jgi:hypothetical protein
MTWQVLVAMFIAVPVILLPVVIVWYLNSGRIMAGIKEMREKQAAVREEEEKRTAAEVPAQGK